MVGFVYWGWAIVEKQVENLMNQLCEKDSNFNSLRHSILGSIQFISEKRHTPLISFAHLTNPLLHSILTRDENKLFVNPMLGDLTFPTDVEHVLNVMIQHRKGRAMEADELALEIFPVLEELGEYFRSEFSALDKLSSRKKLATSWWETSQTANKFSNLAYFARRAHSAQSVSSLCERLFSHTSLVQSELRSSLEASKACLLGAAHESMVSNFRIENEQKSQEDILNFVTNVQKSVDAKTFAEVPQEGFKSMMEWLERVATKKETLLYRAEETNKEATIEASSFSVLQELDVELSRERESRLKLIENCVELSEESKIQAKNRLDRPSRVRRAPSRFV